MRAAAHSNGPSTREQSSNMDNHRTVILGGGLAGLAASVYAGGAPVYEADERAGGVALSDTTAGFTFDRGIHILQTRNEKVLQLLHELGVELQSHSRNAYIYFNGTYTAYPFQVNTAGLPLGLRAKCVWGFLNRGRHPAPTNYEEWIYKSIGTSFADCFLIPYSEKFWTVHPREMTYTWTANRVPQPNLKQVLRGALWSKQTEIGSNVDFRYPVNGAGYGAIAQALRQRAGEVHLSHRATALDTRNRRIQFNHGLEIPYGVLINSIPLPELINICRDAPENVRAAATQLRFNSIVVVNLGIDRPRISDKHWVHFPEKEISFFRISYPHNLSPEVVPRGMSSISAEVAYSAAAPINQQTIIDRVITDLIRVGAMRQDDPIVVRTTRNIKYGYCIYDRQRPQALSIIQQWLASVGIISCGRYGLWTYFWSDEAILSGKKAAEKARQVAELAYA